METTAQMMGISGIGRINVRTLDLHVDPHIGNALARTEAQKIADASLASVTVFRDGMKLFAVESRTLSGLMLGESGGI